MRITLAITVVVALAAPGGLARGGDPPAFVVIVHPSNPVARLDKKTIADAFLKKRTRWGDAGKPILPVDQDKRSVIRRKFTEDILGRNLNAVRTYWIQLVFSGRGVPPREVDSDADVVTFVLEHPGAIGYVSATTDVRTARVVQVK
jgi:ABC-type phosphate transport system substrate-binding protein